jgi:hypothetical protein
MKKRAIYRQGLAVAILVLGALIFASIEALAAGPQSVQLGQSAKELSAEWWEWAYSIPPSVNPIIDTTGEDCVVGQRGDVWFLAGSTGTGGAVTRTCSVPEGKLLFFPVLNVSTFNSPNACGQGPENFTVKQMRGVLAPIMDGATNMSVTLDGRLVRNIQRVRSEVFEVSLPPKDNLYLFFVNYDPNQLPCAGVYSPAVDDGYYAHLDPLPAGAYKLKIHGEIPPSFLLDVTYNLTVVPVTLK